MDFRDPLLPHTRVGIERAVGLSFGKEESCLGGGIVCWSLGSSVAIFLGCPPAGHTRRSLPVLWTVSKGCGVPDEVPTGWAGVWKCGRTSLLGEGMKPGVRGADGGKIAGQGKEMGRRVLQAWMTQWTREASERLWEAVRL